MRTWRRAAALARPEPASIDLGGRSSARRPTARRRSAPTSSSEHLRETPRRVATAYAELLTPVPFNATTFPNDEGYDELVLVRDIPFQSLCTHHLLPFHGMAHSPICPASGSSVSRSSAGSSTSSRATSRSRSV